MTYWIIVLIIFVLSQVFQLRIIKFYRKYVFEHTHELESDDMAAYFFMSCICSSVFPVTIIITLLIANSNRTKRAYNRDRKVDNDRKK